MMDLDIEKLITAIEKGKVRGFDEVKEINGENYLFEYAIKKTGWKIPYLFFHIPENKMAMFEDYTIEEISRSSNIEDALNYFRGQRIEIKKFSAIKGALPF